jgi:hypothetical protein
MATRRDNAGVMTLFCSPVIRGTSPPSVSSRPFVAIGQSQAEPIESPSARENTDIWPVFKIYHMPWRTVRQPETHLNRGAR